MLLILALSLTGCGGLGGEPRIVSTAPPAMEAPGAALAREWQPDIRNGARIFAERCVECHGESGDGRGDLVVAGSVAAPLDMTDHAKVASKSPLEFFEIITKGNIASLMPPWEQALGERERWDLALHSYSLAYDEELLANGERVWRENCRDCVLPSGIPPVYSDAAYAAKMNREIFASALGAAEALAATAYARWSSLTAEPARLPQGEIKGRVRQGTAGGLLPLDTVLRLRYGKADSGYSIAETVAAADGAFRFEGVPLADDFDYALGALYEGRLFSQRISPWQEAAHTITVYDATHDPFVVSIARLDLYIEAVALDDLGAGLYISQILTFRNESDRVYTSGRGFDDGREAALLIQFPQGARLLSGDAGGRYVVIEDLESLPDSAIDTLPVLPGEVHAAPLEFWLPYQDGARFEQEFNNFVDAEVIATLPEALRIDSDWLRESDEAGTVEGYRVYSATLRLDQDPRISFGVSGAPLSTSSDDRLVVTSESLPALLLGLVAVTGALLGGLGLLKRRRDIGGGEIEGLVAALARLEDEHDQGRINHDLYHQRRRDLKARLARLMESADD